MQIFTLLLDALFPPRSSEVLVRSCTRLKNFVHYHTGVLCLTSYQDHMVKAAVVENKFYGSDKAARLLAAPLASYLESRNTPHVLIPIPLGPNRRKERGYNQVASVLKKLPSNTHTSVDYTVLRKPYDTIAQTTLSQSARLQNIKSNVFEVDSRISTYRDITLIIIDDVCTTGATLRAARASLAPHVDPSCQVICLALAH